MELEAGHKKERKLVALQDARREVRPLTCISRLPQLEGTPGSRPPASGSQPALRVLRVQSLSAHRRVVFLQWVCCSGPDAGGASAWQRRPWWLFSLQYRNAYRTHMGGNIACTLKHTCNPAQIA